MQLLPRTIAAALFLLAHTGHADSPAIDLQDATITGSNDTVTVERVPIRTAAGKIVYMDITTEYVTDGSGNISVAAGYPIIQPSKTLLSSHFKAGNYVTTINGNTYHATLGGPGIGPNGTTSWTFSSSDYVPAAATWYVTKDLTQNPEYERLQRNDITSPAYSYGIAGAHGTCDYWETNTLVGASQNVEMLSISSFTFCGNTDKSSPGDTVPWKLAK
jgi:hypothetical protein